MNDKNLSFLLIDDFSPVRKVIKNSLNKLGYDNMTLATNGLEGKKLIIEKKFDCIISDWNMPVMSGIALLQFVRATQKRSQLKLMLVTTK
ncbi:MAG: response regulator [Saccharospirillaceae bacterium]|nr:response regulator [Pseudomonadales bacterium]NRB79813.1 response regulator [Saccharospirillaceae bacterium]